MSAEPTPRPREHVEREPTGDRASAPEPAGTRKTAPGALTEAARRVAADDREVERRPGVHGADPGAGPARPASVEQTLDEP